MKPLIKNLTIEEASELFQSLGEKPYRARQLFVWLYEKNVASFQEMTTFTKDMRSRLHDRYDLEALTLIEREVSSIDGTSSDQSDNFFDLCHINPIVCSINNDTEKSDGSQNCVVLSAKSKRAHPSRTRPFAFIE